MSDNTPLRLLVLMRHAEAKQNGAGGGDFSRELTKKGRTAARQVGAWLLAQGVRPDAVVASPATRTVQTWEQMHQAGLEAGEVWTDSAVYGAAPEDLVESVQAVTGDARTVLVVGHAPGIPELAATLADHTEMDQAQRVVLDAWPPAAVAVVVHRDEWARFPGPDTALALFHAPPG